jgi:NAD(P)-dependent dehydrogenase (short-subunit alcohol dehydrogenase family)
VGRLQGKAALVTGGTSGIGLAVVRRFMQEGAEVVVLARRERSRTKLAGARFVACDVADAEAVRRAFDRAVSELGGLDAAILNAGAFEGDAGVLGLPAPDAAERQWATNAMGVLHGLAAAAQAMDRGGSITITATAALAWSFPGYGGYLASKAPLLQLARTAAMQLGPRGIRVNTVSPGTIVTEMQPEDDDEARVARVATSLGRVGRPEEVAGAYVFLASEDASYVTGADLRVDGGWIEGVTPAAARILSGREPTA